MSSVSVMRRLRHKYGISIRELARIAGVSQQYLSDLELGKYTGIYNYRRGALPMMQKAFEGAAANRLERAKALSDDIAKYHESLFDFTEDNDEL